MPKDNATVDLINRVIKNHGSNQYGDPMFRVVFSDDQVESRKGTFNDYSGNIFVRTTHEVREVKKYPWIKEKWILERWAPGELAYHKDLVTIKDGVYICVYVFQDINYNYLPPLLKVSEIIISNLLHPRGKAQAIAEDEKIEEKTEKQEVDKIEEELIIQSDKSKTEDPKSSRETMSVGYAKDKIGEDENV